MGRYNSGQSYFIDYEESVNLTTNVTVLPVNDPVVQQVQSSTKSIEDGDSIVVDLRIMLATPRISLLLLMQLEITLGLDESTHRLF